VKKILLMIFFLACTKTFAMSCPSNGTIIDTGYSEAQVLQLCGQPVSINAYKATTNLSEELIYYKNIHGSNIKITMLFSYGHLANINTLDAASNQVCQLTNQSANSVSASCASREQNVSLSNVCGQIIQVGYGIGYINSICGNPASQKVLSSVTDEMKEFTYTGPGPTVLVVKNGKLVDWKY